MIAITCDVYVRIACMIVMMSLGNVMFYMHDIVNRCRFIVHAVTVMNNCDNLALQQEKTEVVHIGGEGPEGDALLLSQGLVSLPPPRSHHLTERVDPPFREDSRAVGEHKKEEIARYLQLLCPSHTLPACLPASLPPSPSLLLLLSSSSDSVRQ